VRGGPPELDAEVQAEGCPCRVRRLALDEQHASDVTTPGVEQMPVAEELTKAEPELALFVRPSEALHLGNVERLALMPCDIKERISGRWFERLEALRPDLSGELILQASMTSQASLDDGRIDGKRVSLLHVDDSSAATYG
jgi:hypothetical protein